MGLLDRFRRKKEPVPDSKEPPAPGYAPEADTMALILLREDIGWTAVSNALEASFGPPASVDNSHAQVPAMTICLEGTEFFCSYMPMPHPAEVCDISAAGEGLCSPQEREDILAHKCFLVLAQKGGGETLEKKRNICRLFTRLAGILMELEAAAGVYINSAELLISRRVYLQHTAVLEKNWEDLEYFPAPLWVSIRSGQKGEASLVGTWGLKQFGFPELWFLDAKSPWPELHEKLYLMSIFQITGRERYRNTDTIMFTPGAPAVFKELNGALFIVGGGV